MIVSLVAAVSENGVIGRGNGLPWRLPADLRRFRALTLGHTIVMGRRTFESIGRALDGRRTIVVSRRPDYRPDGVDVVPGLAEALRPEPGETERFVVGGGEIYREALPLADRLYLTIVHAEVEGDVVFPPLDPDGWEVVSEERHPADDLHPFPYTFRRLDRRR